MLSLQFVDLFRFSFIYLIIKMSSSPSREELERKSTISDETLELGKDHTDSNIIYEVRAKEVKVRGIKEVKVGLRRSSRDK